MKKIRLSGLLIMRSMENYADASKGLWKVIFEIRYLICYIRHKKSTHSEGGCLSNRVNVLMDTAYPVGWTG